MSKSVWSALLLSPIALGTVAATEALAESFQSASETARDRMSTVTGIAQLSTDSPPTALESITSVSQLSDVKPTDWAFQALQSLVERYGCIVGYPDRTYRGNRSLSRYEFAAGVNACMNRIEELIKAGLADFATKEDLEALQKLQEEFASELATLRGRVDSLEARTTTLEKQQFSTTTKLVGESVWAITGVAAGDDITGSRVPRIPIFVNRTRLDLNTSFTGNDLLLTRLQSVAFNDLSNTTGTPESSLRFGPGFLGEENGNVEVDALLYQFPLTEKTTVTIEANAGAIDDFTDTVNPFLDGDGGSGALSQFGTRASIYFLLGGTGIGIQHKFSDNLELSLGYLASEAADPSPGSGLFDGPYGMIAQLTVRPFEKLSLGFTYVHAYNTDFTTEGSSGSFNANLFTATGNPVVTNSYGIEASFQPSRKFVINGWAGLTKARVIGLGDGDIWNWAVTLGFPDLLKPGSLAGIVVGMQPKLTNIGNTVSLVTGVTEDDDTSIHVEAFYEFRLNDHIAITPAIIWLTAPNHDTNNSDIVIGTIRTTFTF